MSAQPTQTEDLRRSKSIASTTVGFQGERGAFSEEAAIALLGSDIELVPFPTFAVLFRSVNEELLDYLVVPIENSLIGPIENNAALIRDSSLVTLRDVRKRIQQHLIACPDAKFEEIETAESHPVALAQCQRFFLRHPEIKPIEAEDTAGSVRRIIESGDRRRAAIAGRRAAEIYGGIILKENIEDDAHNYTRFVLLKRTFNGS